MGKKSFKIKNSVSLQETSRQSDSTFGEIYYDQIKKSFAKKSDYWSYLESKIDIAFQTDITSIYFDATVSENAIIKITGSPSANFNLHGLARNNNAKLIHIYNDTNQKMVIKNQSSTELVANARINTPTGNDLSIAKKSLAILFYDEGIGSYIAAQASGGSGGTSFEQIQPAHGFSVLTPIYHDGTQWKKAQANAANTLATYVVTEVSTNAFTATKFGVVEIPSHGLTVGEFYYTSKDTAGDLTPTEPIFGYSNPVLYVQDSTLIHIMAHRPSLIGDGNVSDSEIGAILAFPTAVEPIGFLYCDGRAVSRTTYNELFNRVGTIYGSGDGSTTFNLPDLRGQFLRGGVDFQSYTFLPANVDIGTENITITNHKFKHTGFKVIFSTTGAVPAGLSAGSTYYVIYVDENTVKLASTLANAKAGTAINLTSTGSGTHTLTQYVDPDAASRVSLQNGGATGANFGAFQDDLFESHTHAQDPHNHSYYFNNGDAIYPSGFSASGANPAGTTKYAASTSSTTATNQNTGGNETRPQNITVGYFIRFAAKGAIKGQDVPAGTVLTFAGPVANIPNGYLLCDGSSLNRADYANLFAAIGTAWGTASGTTFNLPDTRGLFLRGVDGVANRDPNKASRTAINTGGNTGNNVGSYQADDSNRLVEFETQLFGGTGAHGEGLASVPQNGNWSNWLETGRDNGLRDNLRLRNSGGETRPKNVYVNYIIKY